MDLRYPLSSWFRCGVRIQSLHSVAKPIATNSLRPYPFAPNSERAVSSHNLTQKGTCLTWMAIFKPTTQGQHEIKMKIGKEWYGIPRISSRFFESNRIQEKAFALHEWLEKKKPQLWKEKWTMDDAPSGSSQSCKSRGNSVNCAAASWTPSFPGKFCGVRCVILG